MLNLPCNDRFGRKADEPARMNERLLFASAHPKPASLLTTKRGRLELGEANFNNSLDSMMSSADNVTCAAIMTCTHITPAVSRCDRSPRKLRAAMKKCKADSRIVRLIRQRE